MSVFIKIADRFLRMPELRGLSETDFDAPEATRIQRRLFKTKKILGFLYQEYCQPVMESACRAPDKARMLEIGSGISPLKESLPGLICSDVVHLPWIDLACSAYALPFSDKSLDRIFLLFVFHHLGRVEEFLDEARRCLKPGGEIIIVEPAITRFSRMYYKYLHVDDLDLLSSKWGFDGQGRLSDNNIALAWAVFFRDHERFAALYPEFEIKRVQYNTCLSFLLSGGMRARQVLPTWALKTMFGIENWLIQNISSQFAVTMALTIKRT